MESRFLAGARAAKLALIAAALVVLPVVATWAAKPQSVVNSKTTEQGFAVKEKGDGLEPTSKGAQLYPRSNYVWPYATGPVYGDVDAAQRNDAAQCEQSRARSGVRSPCTLYSVNGQVVYGRNYSPKTAPRSPGKVPEQTTTKSGYGTGFPINDDGVILTSYHVVKVAKKIDVQFQDGATCPAKVLKQSPNIDIAILKIDKPTPDYLVMDSQPEIGVGDRVFTIGFPVDFILGQEPKFTDGAISALSGLKGEARFLQITVPVQRYFISCDGFLLLSIEGITCVISPSTNRLRFSISSTFF